MKLVYISDLHIDAGALGSAAATILPELAAEAEPDVFIIGGDIASNLPLVERTLNSFSIVSGMKLFVPGNHDIWIDDLDVLSREKYYILLPKACRDNGFVFLPGNPVTVDRLGFAGTIGWYDYSFRNPELDHLIPEQSYRRKHFRGYVWNDRRYARWEASDPEVAKMTAGELDADLSALDPKVDKIVVITHHLPFVEMVRRSGDPSWDFFGAFMGSAMLGEVILSHPKVSTVLCGHTHFTMDMTIHGIRVMTSPLGYTHERSGPPRQVIKESLLVMEL